ncbi:MAG: hypothetical protein JWN15_933 [Firmicutes bacterium]|nr:hypothetical protein [Bacillota bacterium]
MRLTALLVVVALLGWPTAASAADEEPATQAFDGSARALSVMATDQTSGPGSRI